MFREIVWTADAKSALRSRSLVEQNLMLMSQVFSSRKMGTPCRSEAQASLVWCLGKSIKQIMANQGVRARSTK
jgi:hypothetical protein